LITYIASGNGQQWTGFKVCLHNYTVIVKIYEKHKEYLPQNMFHLWVQIWVTAYFPPTNIYLVLPTSAPVIITLF
jgi:hypothetical protein